MGGLSGITQAPPGNIVDGGGGLQSMIGKLSGDIFTDYSNARQANANRAPQIEQATQEAVDAPMQGFDGNAYQAQAWGQAGIGAATPTISALESLNRAIAGYSGVKLQERADYGKRVAEAKALKLNQLNMQQKQDMDIQQNAGKQLIDMFRNGQISRAQLLRAASERFVNVPGRGLTDKQLLAQELEAGRDGNAAVVVPALNPAQMFQQLQSSVALEAEQNKNLHFKTESDRNAWMANTVKRRWTDIVRSSNGALPMNPYAQQQYQPEAPQAPLDEDGLPDMNWNGNPVPNMPMQPKGPVRGNMLNTPVSPSEMTLMPGEVPPGAGEDPSLTLKPIYGGGRPPTIINGPGQYSGPPPAMPGMAEPPAMPEQPAQPVMPAAPWGSYATRPFKVADTSQPTGMYDKTASERIQARNAASEKNAEDMYIDIAKQAESSAEWGSVLQELSATDVSKTGSFANVRNSAGKLLASLGYENAGLAQDAQNLSKINNLLMQGIQARLSTQNGVQAADDAVRERQSFAQITDPRKVFKALVTQAQAKTERVVEKEAFYNAWKAKNGSFVGASTEWNNYIKDTPIFAMYGGQPIYYNQFIKAFISQNAQAFKKDGVPEEVQVQQATDAWRKIAKKR